MDFKARPSYRKNAPPGKGPATKRAFAAMGCAKRKSPVQAPGSERPPLGSGGTGGRRQAFRRLASTVMVKRASGPVATTGTSLGAGASATVVTTCAEACATGRWV